MTVIADPKQKSSSSSFRTHWYPYYAGFSPFFAESVINYLKPSDGALLVDPWNGSGTTTFVAAKLGIESIGIDLNPVMTVVAKARSSTIEDYVYAKALALDAIANSDDIEFDFDENDMLNRWFTKESSYIIRKLERSILYSRGATRDLIIGAFINESESLVYLSLFRVIRNLIKRFIGTNDTWVKSKIKETDKISISRHEIITDFAKETSFLFKESTQETRLNLSKPKIITDSSRKISISDGMADIVITSPPYCTRIDYAIKTLPELALLGYDFREIDNLRRDLMGTTTVPKNVGNLDGSWGKECFAFMNALLSHRSKASSGYYYKSHYSYFENLYASLGEISRILNKDGKAVLVIQDSYYKDLHNNVPRIIIEMGEILGLHLDGEYSFVKENSMSSMNKRSYLYRPNYKPVEKVLILSK